MSEGGTLTKKPKEKETKNRFAEKSAMVSFSTYKNYFLSNKTNCVLLPITLVLFLMS